jgi:hypothetical protein
MQLVERDVLSAHRWLVVIKRDDDSDVIYGPYGSEKDANEAMESSEEIRRDVEEDALDCFVDHQDRYRLVKAYGEDILKGRLARDQAAAIELLKCHEETGIDLTKWAIVKDFVENQLDGYVMEF